MRAEVDRSSFAFGTKDPTTNSDRVAWIDIGLAQFDGELATHPPAVLEVLLRMGCCLGQV